MSIQWKSLAVSGCAAGLVILVGGFSLAHFVLGPEYVDRFKAALPGGLQPTTAVSHLVLRLLWGFLGVFLYVGFRPRFGPGPATAFIAAAVLWLAAYLPATLSLHQFGILTGWRLAVTVPWTLGEAALACLIGAWPYKE